jgi:hypothetical protein
MLHTRVEVTCLGDKWMDDSGTHGLSKVEQEEDRWTGVTLSTYNSKSDTRGQLHTHLNAREWRCETFFN